jgi:CheY-like chemotaxis protein
MDAALGESTILLMRGPRDLRSVQSRILDAARIISAVQGHRAILVLEDPLISEERLRSEWSDLAKILRPEILDSIALVIQGTDSARLEFGTLSKDEAIAVEKMMDPSRMPTPRKNRPSDAFGEILKVLLIHWFRRSGPLSAKRLGEETGFSYPTIAGALERLETSLSRHSNRGVEIASFPRQEWSLLVAQSEKARATERYADRSGRPRPVQVLLDRLRELEPSGIAVGGVLGARRYLPGLDLVGSPRLDLVLQSGSITETSRLLRQLDPALVPAEPGEPCQVVIRTLFRPKTFFASEGGGLRWADEVECLLDLHEARLEEQAMELLARLTKRAKEGLRILVVDDAEGVARTTCKLLRAIGHKVTAAHDGNSALKHYAKALGASEPFDLVLLDMSLPGEIDENQLFEAIRQLDPNSRIVAVSALLEADDLSKRGFNGSLEKPYGLPELRQVIQSAMFP